MQMESGEWKSQSNPETLSIVDVSIPPMWRPFIIKFGKNGHPDRENERERERERVQVGLTRSNKFECKAMTTRRMGHRHKHDQNEADNKSFSHSTMYRI